MKTLIVARWIEDVDWTAKVPDGWTVRVVQKGRDLPNLGREPASFLWAILGLYGEAKPDDLLGFVQGNPFSHSANLFEQLEQPAAGFVPLVGDGFYGTTMLSSDAEGNPHHAGLPVARLYERWLGDPFPGQVHFWAGGQFMVTGERLLQRPESFYRRMFDDLLGEGDAPWVFERLWPSIFGGAS